MKQDHWVWDALSVAILILIAGMVFWFTWIFFDPATPLNPLPFPTLPVAASLPTVTPVPTAAPSDTPTPEPSPTPTLTFTPTPQPTIIAATPVTSLPTATPTPQTSYYSFVVQGEIQAIDSSVVHPAEGCNWQGIAGQVFNTSGAPVLYMGVQIGGRYNGRDISEYILTGFGPDYVKYGFEYKLGDHPVASDETLWVRLVDQQYLALSRTVYITTTTDCTKNLILLNFIQVK